MILRRKSIIKSIISSISIIVIVTAVMMMTLMMMVMVMISYDYALISLFFFLKNIYCSEQNESARETLGLACLPHESVMHIKVMLRQSDDTKSLVCVTWRPPGLDGGDVGVKG